MKTRHTHVHIQGLLMPLSPWLCVSQLQPVRSAEGDCIMMLIWNTHTQKLIVAKITNTTEGHIKIEFSWFSHRDKWLLQWQRAHDHKSTHEKGPKHFFNNHESVYCNQLERSCTPFSALKAVHCRYLSQQAYNQVNQNHVYNGPFIQYSIHWCKLSTNEMNIKGTQCGYYMLLYVPAHFSASHLKSTVPYQCFPQTRGNTSTSKVPKFFKRTKLKQRYRKAFIKYHMLHSQQCHRTVPPDGYDLSNPFKKVPDLHTTFTPKHSNLASSAHEMFHEF